MRFIIDPIRWGLSFLFFINILTATAAHGPVHAQIKQLTKAIDKNPDSLLLFLERGLYYQIDEDLDNAIADFQQVLKLDKNVNAVNYPLAEIYFEKENYQLASQYIIKHIDRHPQHANGYALLGDIQLEIAEDSLAIMSFEKVIAIKKENSKPEDFFKLSKVLKKDKPLKAYKVLEQGIDWLGPILSIQTMMIEIAIENKWYGRAMLQVNSILATTERKEYWLLQKAIVLEAQGHKKLAKENYTNCLAEIAGLKPKTKETDFVKAICLKAEFGTHSFVIQKQKHNEKITDSPNHVLSFYDGYECTVCHEGGLIYKQGELTVSSSGGALVFRPIVKCGMVISLTTFLYLLFSPIV